MRDFWEQRAAGQRYAVAAVILLVAVLVRLYLDYHLGLHRAPFLTLYPTLVIVAYFCGFGPGVMTLVATTVMGCYWSFVLNRASDTLGQVAVFLGVFFSTGVITLLIVRDMQLALSETKHRLSTTAMVNGEMRHRIKNILAIASAIASKTVRANVDAEDAARALTGRFVALGAVYDALTDDAREGVSLRALLDRVVYPLIPDSSQYSVVGDHDMLPAHVATTFGLVLHELATNALKHGAWKDPDGKVSVGWFVENDTLWFQWCERCGACQCTLLPQTKPVASTGLKLIERSLPDAQVTHEIGADGLRCTIVLPLKL